VPQRIKGQEITIAVTRGGTLEDTFTSVQDFESSDKLEIIEKGYLGEKGNRHDFIFNGNKGSFTLHLQTQDYYRFIGAIKAKAKREQPDLEFNISRTSFFPNGDSPVETFPNVSFGEIPQKVSARNDYVSAKFDFACDDNDVALT
jgi:hypothetical protein